MLVMRRIGGWGLLVLLIVLSTGRAKAQIAETWGSLRSGEHAVGFKTVEVYDHSRVFRVKTDYFGDFQEGERSRPIQVAIWYPAILGSDSTTMVYGAYSFPYMTDQSFARLIQAFQGRDVRIVRGHCNNNEGAHLNAINVPFYAVRDAPPQTGPFPLIVYHPDSRSSYCENALLCEYLASHGFVVATSHNYGATEVNEPIGRATHEINARDKEFVLAVMRDEPYVDRDRLGLLGRGGGGTSALLMQMRNRDVDVVVTLDGAFLDPEHADQLTGHPSYNVSRMAVPHLMLTTAADTDPASELPGLLVYSDRYTIEVTGSNAPRFGMYRLLCATIGEAPAEDATVAGEVYRNICDNALTFFSAYLLDDSDARATLPASLGVSAFAEGQEVPPTGPQFIRILQTRGVQMALSIYERVRAADSTFVPFPEATGNRLGYRWLGQGQVEDAMLLFGINAELYPNSANAWDSYADGCIAAGRREAALDCYKKALEVLPNDSTADAQTKIALRGNAERFISEYDNSD